MTYHNIQQLMASIQDAAYEVRRHLEPGYLEKVYQNALEYELILRGLKVLKECYLPVNYKGHYVGEYYADLFVEDKIILEIKACKEFTLQHEIQLVNYLKITGVEYGFLINYGGDKFQIKKKYRDYRPSPIC